MKSVLSALFAVALFLLPRSSVAAPISIDFEGLDDSLFLGGTIPGLTFSNATVLTAGVSLNKIDLPPSSGSNVAFDDGGGIRIDFSSPVFSVAGHVNYYSPVTLQALDSSDNLVGSVSTLFGINAVGLGDPGRTPNELLQPIVAAAAYVTLTGDPLGRSFTIDDLMSDLDAPAPAPEPGTLMMSVAGAAATLLRRTRPRRTRRCG